MAIGPGAKEERHLARHQIAPGKGLHMPLHRHLAGVMRQARDGRGKQRALGYIGEQRINRGGTDDTQHGAAVIMGKRQITHGVTAP